MFNTTVIRGLMRRLDEANRVKRIKFTVSEDTYEKAFMAAYKNGKTLSEVLREFIERDLLVK